MYFKKLIEAKNEYVLPLQFRIQIFFIVGIFAMVIKLACTGAEDWISFEFSGPSDNLDHLQGYLEFVSFLSLTADIAFSVLIIYYLQTT